MRGIERIGTALQRLTVFDSMVTTASPTVLVPVSKAPTPSPIKVRPAQTAVECLPEQDPEVAVASLIARYATEIPDKIDETHESVGLFAGG